MSQYKISKKRLAEIIKEEYESILSETSATTNEKLTLDQVEIDEESELEEGKPDYIDLDKDGDKEEPMKEAAKGKAQDFKDEKTKEVMSKMRK